MDRSIDTQKKDQAGCPFLTLSTWKAGQDNPRRILRKVAKQTKTNKGFAINIFLNFYWLILREREKVTSILLFHLFMHSLVDSCTCPDHGRTCNLGVSGRCSNQLSYAARAQTFTTSHSCSCSNHILPCVTTNSNTCIKLMSPSTIPPSSNWNQRRPAFEPQHCLWSSGPLA